MFFRPTVLGQLFKGLQDKKNIIRNQSLISDISKKEQIFYENYENVIRQEIQK